MSKSHHANKMEKKKPMQTPKEKRAAKRMKKQHEQELLHPPLVTH